MNYDLVTPFLDLHDKNFAYIQMETYMHENSSMTLSAEADD